MHSYIHHGTPCMMHGCDKLPSSSHISGRAQTSYNIMPPRATPQSQEMLRFRLSQKDKDARHSQSSGYNVTSPFMLLDCGVQTHHNLSMAHDGTCTGGNGLSDTPLSPACTALCRVSGIIDMNEQVGCAAQHHTIAKRNQWNPY